MVVRKAFRSGAMAAVIAATGLAGTPAAAQFYLKNQSYPGQPVQGDETGIGQPMPGATPAELRASLVWNMRAALNVAALQCGFEPTLLTVTNYNAVLKDHTAELKGAFDTLTKYFVRVGKTKPKGQSMLDQFGTRTYSSFVTVAGQFAFCQTAASIGRDAVFTPRGQFGALSANRMAELRASLTSAFYETGVVPLSVGPSLPLPRLDAQCWDKKGRWRANRCGAFAFSPAA
ncbi:hypothetical protein [Sphingomonas sp.]|uniref:hypothetical protein n=1 Tax=Sphingomonas sp. TaxID=28214 RepID=UPI003B001082